MNSRSRSYSIDPIQEEDDHNNNNNKKNNQMKPIPKSPLKKTISFADENNNHNNEKEDEPKVKAQKRLSRQQTFLSDLTARISDTLQSVTIATTEDHINNNNNNNEDKDKDNKDRDILVPQESVGSLPVTPREPDDAIPVVATVPIVPAIPIQSDNTGLAIIPPNYRELSRADKDVVLTRVEHALKLTSRILVDQQDAMTQTPDDWMIHIHEGQSLSIKKKKMNATANSSNAGPNSTVPWTMLMPSMNHSDDGSMGSLDDYDDNQSMKEPYIHLHTTPSTDDMMNSTTNNNDSSHFFHLTIPSACQLIEFIYESKISEILHYHHQSSSTKKKTIAPYDISYWEEVTFLQFVKESIVKRYRIRRISNKFYKSLLLSCIQQSINSRRLELFSMLCGIATPDRSNVKFLPHRCYFFFRLLSLLCHYELDAFINMFTSQIIDRALVLDVISTVFEEVETKDNELFNEMIFEIIDLPAMEPELIESEYKVIFFFLLFLYLLLL